MSNAELTWFKSSYSDGEGGDCVEVAYSWFKSSYSDGEGGECPEVAALPTTIRIRDSKRHPTAPHLTLSPTAWQAFLPLTKSPAAPRGTGE
ncbi:DUF397 domain-containing protein [Streptomyces sp. NPDC051636]|uniref:DUF397 domain-containing protein n=1 Tax=Streptomyces sp. NPDC051636 TaxID=3365663 RepID=UPI0037AB64B2